MQEIARVTLENEMDLILAHKRTMKVAELSGLSLSAQTTFATAVSEVSRNVIEGKKKGMLVLSVQYTNTTKYIIASLKADTTENKHSQEGLEYAKKLVNKYNVSTKGTQTSIDLFYHITPSFKIDIAKLDEWRTLFRNEPPVSPYEELKRKNEQLEELSEKLHKSEMQYQIVTNSLPLILFSLDNNGQLIYANEGLQRYLGETAESLNNSQWKQVVHADDYDSFILLLKSHINYPDTIVKTQARFRIQDTGEYVWHQLSLSPFNDDNGNRPYWIGYLADIHAQKIHESTLKENLELMRSNNELQQFAFVASHDLQEPVRKFSFYSDYLLNNCLQQLDERGASFLRFMNESASRMRELIQDLLMYSQVNKGSYHPTQVSLNQIAAQARHDLELAITDQQATITVEELPTIHGDANMLTQLFTNLMGNAVKYAREGVPPHITINVQTTDQEYIIRFQDNGIGFSNAYASQIFNLFQRLHGKGEFHGTGIGLSVCKKIMDLHNGTIWAEGVEHQGATFYTAFPK